MIKIATFIFQIACRISTSADQGKVEANANKRIIWNISELLGDNEVYGEHRHIVQLARMPLRR